VIHVITYGLIICVQCPSCIIARRIRFNASFAVGMHRVKDGEVYKSIRYIFLLLH